MTRSECVSLLLLASQVAANEPPLPPSLPPPPSETNAFVCDLQTTGTELLCENAVLSGSSVAKIDGSVQLTNDTQYSNGMLSYTIPEPPNVLAINTLSIEAEFYYKGFGTGNADAFGVIIGEVLNDDDHDAFNPCKPQKNPSISSCINTYESGTGYYLSLIHI